jgi:hypothetical protein
LALELTTLSKCQSYLSDTTLTSGVMNPFMNAAEAMLAEYVGRRDQSGNHWLSASHTEYLSGEFSDGVRLKWTPVKAVTSVERVESATTDTDYTLTDLAVDGKPISGLSSDPGTVGILHLRACAGAPMTLAMFAAGYPYAASSFYGGYKRIKVVYTGGYSAAPADASLAATALAATLYRRKSMNPTVESENFGRYGYTNKKGDELTQAIPPEVASLVDHYRRIL